MAHLICAGGREDTRGDSRSGQPVVPGTRVLGILEPPSLASSQTSSGHLTEVCDCSGLLGSNWICPAAV